MKLYQSVGPNPRVVLFYLAEKGLQIDRVLVDIMSGENRQGEWLKKHPRGGIPVLELDDGSLISEATVICDYLDERFPEKPLAGATPEARAAVRAAIRHIDYSIGSPMMNGFRSAEGLPMFENRMLCVPEAAPGNKAYAQDGLRQADALLATQPFVAGDSFTLADIALFCWVEFGAMVGQPMPDDAVHLKAWRDRIAAMPSAIASADAKHGLVA